jgi:hydrogenase maturation protease
LERVLLIGFGNPGRRDDGLGPAVAQAAEGWGIPGVTVESDYQLHVEDAAAVSEHDAVIFADAAAAGPEPFAFGPLAAEGEPSFTTHSVSPGAVLKLSRDLFSAETAGYLLAIRGYDFDGFGEGLSEPAAANLARALDFLRTRLSSRDFAGAVGTR